MSDYNAFLEVMDSQSCVTNKTTVCDKSYIDNLCALINIEYDAQHKGNNDNVCKMPIKIINPNDYPPMTNYNRPFYNKSIVKSVVTTPLICITDEVNTIDDLLNIINKYSYNPLNKYNIDLKALHNIKIPLEALNNMVGMKTLKNNVVVQLLYFIQDFHKHTNTSSGDYMHTIIYGPPGTGKTEIAKILGAIYSKLGILQKNTFKKVTRGDLIAGYLGQTALKTAEVIKEALGGVLFIDEAYALGNSDQQDMFSKECIDTLCEALSDNKNNLMVIIAGYEKELERCFFNYNQGLNSRFVWRFKTDEYNGEELYNIFVKKVKDIGWNLSSTKEITPSWFQKNKDQFTSFGRDIDTLLSKIKISHSKRVFGKDCSLKKQITLPDLDNGLIIYLQNKPTNNDNYLKREMLNTLYS